MSRVTISLITLACLGILSQSCGKKTGETTPPPADIKDDEWRGAATEAVKKGLAFLESQDPKGAGVWMR
ncbi:MAG: hypothetical protein ACYTFG_18930, partial [Planctomycetota bacterium]